MRITVTIVFFCIALVSLAQTKVIHDGEACYLHSVEKGNTLYGISKQYAVSIDEILKFNPEARIGLSIGQKVFIPISSVDRKEARTSPDLNGNVLVHTVGKKETLYSLSKRYKVEINALLEANPGLEEKGLKKGDVISIPVQAVNVKQAYKRLAARDSLIHHEVLLGETLFSLSKNYQVSIDSIKSVNGGLKEGLRAGMTLRIPKYVTGFSSFDEIGASDSEKEHRPLVKKPRFQVNLGLLLPFSLSLTDTIGKGMARGSDDVLKLTDIAYEFYRGSQMALDELSARGLSADVVVLDVTGERKSVDRCLRSSELEELDLIIGPLHKESFEMISSDGRLKDVFRASPLSASLDISARSDQRIAKIHPSVNVLVADIVKDIKRNHEGENIVLLSGDIRSWHNEFMAAWNLDTLMTDSLERLPWNKDAHVGLLENLDPNGPNVLIFPNEHRPTITDLISNLATSEFRSLDITLYGLEQWLKYDNLDADVLERVNLHLPTGSHIDWEDKEVIDFVKEYSGRYNVIPSSTGYALLAYDLVTFYVEGIMMYGSEFLDNQNQVTYEGLCSGFDMRKTDSGGWVNQFVYMLEYDDHEFKITQ